MFKSFFKYSILILAATLIFGCNPNMPANDKVVAEVGGKRLLFSEVASVIPNNLEPEDSAAMAEDYIRKWVRQELILQKAEENLSTELKNVTRELEEYRKSLIIFRYKNELMAQRMDTVVSDSEIQNYYTENAQNFKLTKAIVKAVFMKVPADFANPSMLKELTSDTSAPGINEIRDYCIQYAKSFGIYTDQWVELDAVMQNLPISVDNPEQFLSRNQFVEHTDSSYYYLVAIQDYMLRNEQAPVEYVADNIKSLILNRRKISFLKKVEDNIFQEGRNKNSFKIYNSETDETE
ncbi:hypothetical protein [Mariniphaga sp.]|uniref:hypothetical protein n=1 Tax=Mariniphaga sp. TaxID=1954475 RepID=UPI00356868A9